jgi:hypothetical protein
MGGSLSVVERLETRRNNDFRNVALSVTIEPQVVSNVSRGVA